MPICRYFQEGRCRFGDKCWNEHLGHRIAGIPLAAASQATHWVSPSYARRHPPNFPASSSTSFNQNYAYFQNTGFNSYSEKNIKQYDNYDRTGVQSNTKNNSQFDSFPSDKRGNKKEAQLLAVKQDIESWENEHIWPFSCYAHFENKRACFPGFTDISPEELRYKAYEAEKRNRFLAYEADVGTILRDVKEKWTVLKQMPSSHIESIQPEFHLNLSCPDSVRDIICHNEKGFSNNACDNMQTEGQLFSNQPFDASNSFKLTHLSSVNPSTVSSASTFVLPPDEEMKTESGSSGALLEFVSSQSSKPQSYPVLSSSSALPENKAATKAFSQTGAINVNYTPLESLTEQEKLQFSAVTFTLGKVPTRPPPLEMCF